MKPEISFDAVRELALDIWDDLGRTRLAGLAVALTVALLAIMVVVLRPAGAPEIKTNPEFATAMPSSVGNEVSFTTPGEKPLKLADVDLSAPRDPFRSGDGIDSGQTLLPASENAQDTVLGSSTGATPAALSASNYDATSLQPIEDLAPDTGTTEPDTPRGELADENQPEPTPAPVTDYSYAADIQFGLVDDLKRYASVQRLGLVPSKRLPLLMYLGVAPDHKTAVFMVDSRLSQGGEGRCVPKDSLCTFLELRASAEQDEHHFRDADGNEYLLRLRGLVRTTASDGRLAGRSVSELNGTPPVVDGSR